ncbi:MAG: MqnA/MqnD/SBP family protein [Rubricoccaceae bacterium]|nr:MqnA/MqnD/SBP family protein [Rubricoccaceae bacterium]
MRIAIWPIEALRTFAEVLRDRNVISEVIELEPYAVRPALQAKEVDAGLVPTMDVLRSAGEFDVLPGVAFVGERSPNKVMVLSSQLDSIGTVAFDPRYGQEALLSQIILKEHYGGKPVFKPIDPDSSVGLHQGSEDANLVSPETVTEHSIVLDLGLEWMELTLRPMVWGLFAALRDTTDPHVAKNLRDSVAQLPPTQEARESDQLVYQFTLDGYAMDGLEEFAKHLFYHGILPEIPEISFVGLPEKENEVTED